MRTRIALLSLAVAAPSLLAQEPEPAKPPTIELPGIEKLTIGGQYRLRYEYLRDFDFDDDAGASNDFFGQRVRVDLRLDLNARLAAFAQIQDVRNWGEESSTIDDSADGLDLHQGWLEVRDVPGIGGAARLGRQDLSLGAERLIGGLDWANQGRSFDGIVQRWDLADEQVVRAFFLVLRELINATNDDAYLFGSYATFHPVADATLDAYAIFLHDDGAVGPGMSHNRVTLGARWLQRCGGLEVESEAATQVGEKDGADIPIGETFAAHLHGTYRLGGACAPWLRADVDVASGDRASTADNERFDNLFPTAHAHWGIMDLAFWSNMLHAQAEVGFEPCARTRCSAAWHGFRTLAAGDAFGGPNGVVSPGGPGISRTMGQEIDLLVAHDLGFERIKSSISGGYGVFLPGAGVQDARGTDDIAHFVYVMTSVRF
jgi:hypothetical protein